MKKLITILGIIALVLCLGTTVFATESEAPTTTIPVVTTAVAVTETPAEESPAEWFVNGFVDNLDKILAGIGGLISMIVLILQKSTIIPQQNAFVANTSSTFTAFAKDISTFRSDMEKNIDNITAVVASSLDTIKEVVAKVAELQQEQSSATEDRKALKTALAAEADMLNTIIQASTLAQWKKDEAGEMHKTVIAAANAIAPSEGGDNG